MKLFVWLRSLFKKAHCPNCHRWVSKDEIHTQHTILPTIKGGSKHYRYLCKYCSKTSEYHKACLTMITEIRRLEKKLATIGYDSK